MRHFGKRIILTLKGKKYIGKVRKEECPLLVTTQEKSILHRERENLVNRYLTATLEERSQILNTILDIDRQLGYL